jgi:hypothetical protein
MNFDHMTTAELEAKIEKVSKILPTPPLDYVPGFGTMMGLSHLSNLKAELKKRKAAEGVQ